MVLDPQVSMVKCVMYLCSDRHHEQARYILSLWQRVVNFPWTPVWRCKPWFVGWFNRKASSVLRKRLFNRAVVIQCYWLQTFSKALAHSGLRRMIPTTVFPLCILLFKVNLKWFVVNQEQNNSCSSVSELGKCSLEYIHSEMLTSPLSFPVSNLR